jgi:V-type H+-transporting ATPase subunit a
MQKIKEQGYHGIGGSGHGANGDYGTEDETDAEDGGANGHAVSQPVEEAEESHDFGEVVIHQVIRESCVTKACSLS